MYTCPAPLLFFFVISLLFRENNTTWYQFVPGVPLRKCDRRYHCVYSSKIIRFFFIVFLQSEIRKYREVYRLYKFPKRPVVEHNGAMTPRSRTAPSRVGGAGAGAGAVDAKAAQGWAKHVTREAAI